MIRAEEILGEVRPPVWRGKTRVHSTRDEEHARVAATKAEKNRAAIAARRAKTAALKPLWAVIGTEIRRQRNADRNLTRKIVARRLDIGVAGLAEYETGNTPIPPGRWPAVLEVFGIDIAARIAEWEAKL